MLCAVLHEPGDVRVIKRAIPRILHPKESVVRVSLAGICGSDLWAYRGIARSRPRQAIGHEFIGEVVAIGAEVVRLSVGDEVLAPFSWNCGSCQYCRVGLTSSCSLGGVFGKSRGSSGGQSQYVRVPHAEATLLRLPPGTSRGAQAISVLLCGDVLATGLHANQMGSTHPDDRCVVVGDGSVGMAAALMARRAGVRHITLVGRHSYRLGTARGVDSTVLVQERSRDPEVCDIAADVVLDCVGTQDSLSAAVSMTEDGGRVAVVGVPHGASESTVGDAFRRNISMSFGLTPARTYMPQLLQAIFNDDLETSWLVDAVMPLRQAADGYRLMAARSVLKVVLEA